MKARITDRANSENPVPTPYFDENARNVWLPKAMNTMAKPWPNRVQSRVALVSLPLSQYLVSTAMLRQPAKTPGPCVFELGLLRKLQEDLV